MRSSSASVILGSEHGGYRLDNNFPREIVHGGDFLLLSSEFIRWMWSMTQISELLAWLVLKYTCHMEEKHVNPPITNTN